MSRIVVAIVLVTVLAVGGEIIATTAYQAGVAATVTTTAVGAGTVVAPVVVPAYGYGWGWPGPGFGFFGFLFALFFLFIVFGLIRAVIFGGRRSHGWGGPGWDRDERDARMRSRFHGTLEEWHREAHAGPDRPVADPPAN